MVLLGGDWFGGVCLPPMALDTDLASSVKASDNSFLLDRTGGAPHRWNIVPSGGVSLLTCQPMLIASAQSLYWSAVYLVWCSPFRFRTSLGHALVSLQ